MDWDNGTDVWQRTIGVEPRMFVEAHEEAKSLRTALMDAVGDESEILRLCLSVLATAIGRPSHHAGIVGTMSPAKWLQALQGHA
jgi:hypothetical protein